MPIPIIIAVIIALFALGANVNQPKGSPAKVVILGGKQYNWVDKKNNRDKLEVKAPIKNDQSIISKGQRQSVQFENIFQFSGLYQILKAEPMMPVNNSINRKMKQAVCMSVK